MSKVLMNNSEIHQYPPKVLQHQKLCGELNALYEKKNHDYGDSFHTTFIEEGMAMPRIRLSDKLSRFNTLSRGAGQQVSDEALRDTLIDLANYALMTVMELDIEKNNANSDAKAEPVDEKAVSRLAAAIHDKPVKIGICFNYDDITFATRGDAESVLMQMDELIDVYGSACVADFYDLAGVTGNYTDNKYGWIDLQSATVIRMRDGYIIKFPKVMELDLEKSVETEPVDKKAATQNKPVKIGICFNTTFDADRTLQVMEAEINHHGFVTIAALSNYVGLHNLVGPDGPDPNHYGWTDLQSVRKCQTMDGAMVYFPEAISIGSFITPSSNARPYLEYTDGQPLPKKGDASTLPNKQ